MTGQFFSFAKKPNSTAKPTGGTSVTFRLKGACSMQAPVITMKGNSPINLFNAYNVIVGQYPTSSGGWGTSTSYNTSDYIPVTAGHTLSVSRGSTVSSSCRIVWYDASFNRLSVNASQVNAAFTVTVPAGAFYVRIPYPAAYQSTVSVTDSAITGARPNYNYAYISSFGGRYYFIRDISYELGEWVLSLECDVLASFKTSIGNSSQYVLRSASAYDEYIVDALYPAKTPPDVTTDPQAVGVMSQKGTYILGVAGQGGVDSAKGGVTYYALSPAQMNTFQTYLHQNAFSAAMAGQYAAALAIAVQDVVESFTHIFEYIRSCIWIPISYLPGSATPIYVGEFTFVDSGGAYVIYGHELDDVNTNFTISHTVPAHPQAATEGAWLNSRPFKHMTLTAPGLGSIDLSPDVFRTGDTVDLWCDLSLIDGSIQADLYRNLSSDGRYLGRYTGSLGVQIPLSQMANDPLAFLTSVHSAVQTFNSQFDTNPIGAVLGAAGQLVSAASAICPQPAQLTPAGSGYHVSGDSTKSRLTTYCYRIVDTDNTSHGRPLCQVKTINTLSGYVLCENAEIAIATATADECDKIINFLNGGFYYE